MITVVLVRTRFPENVGMAARACANFGPARLVLVDPERWDPAKAMPLATGPARDVLGALRVVPTLADALVGHVLAVGATARTGGWRRELLPPREAARRLNAVKHGGGRAALVFGPEDTGLDNAHIRLCSHLVTIPTAVGASSLNLAQAVLLLLHACFSDDREPEIMDVPPDEVTESMKGSRPALVDEQEMLFAALKDALGRIGYLPPDNPDWFMEPLRRLFIRSELRRHEVDLLMGICRKIRHATDKSRDSEKLIRD